MFVVKLHVKTFLSDFDTGLGADNQCLAVKFNKHLKLNEILNLTLRL